MEDHRNHKRCILKFYPYRILFDFRDFNSTQWILLARNATGLDQHVLEIGPYSWKTLLFHKFCTTTKKNTENEYTAVGVTKISSYKSNNNDKRNVVAALDSDNDY